MKDLFTTIGIIAGALISIGILLKPLRIKVKRVARWFEQFMRDWEGEPSHSGRDAVPGVMQRLNKLDGELSNNGGKSTKDIVDKLYKNQEAIMDTQEQLLGAFVEMGDRLITIETHIVNTKTSTEN